MTAALKGLCRERNLAALALFGLSALFTLSYWDRFLAPSSAGAFYYVAEQVLAGHMPYRDFFFVAPPLHALKLSLLLSVFGDGFLVTRFDALIERSVLAVVVYFWLLRFVRGPAAFCGSLLAVVVFACDPADALASYHHDSVFWGVLAGYSASSTLDTSSAMRRSAAAFVSGAFAGLCILTKQTTGLGITAAIPIILAWLWIRSGHPQRILGFVAAYGAGWSIPVAALLLWLIRNEALQAFFDCVFGNTSAKGSGWSLYLRPVVQIPFHFLAAVLLLALVAYLTARLRPGTPMPSHLAYVISGTILTLVVLAGGPAWLAAAARPVRTVVVSGSLYGAAGLLAWSASRPSLEPRYQHIALLAGVSGAIGYMLSLSWAAYEPMVMPGLALIAALALNRSMSSTVFWRSTYFGAYLFLLAANSAAKLQHPFGWLGWDEPPVARADAVSSLPKLAGLRISRPSLDITERVIRAIHASSRPGDPVFVYPYLPMFYVLSGRRPSTHAFTHFIDVAPDAICRRDAAQLLQNPPKMIVELEESPQNRENEERVFRAGEQSGSRMIVNAIRKLTQSYRLLESFQVPGSGGTLRVWARDEEER